MADETMSVGTTNKDPLDADGPAAPPRANGELVFTAPWQSRVFATTMSLWRAGHIDWERFRQGLIGRIAEREQGLTNPDDYDYWACWQQALEELLGSLETVSGAELDRTSKELAARPAGHDHGDHSHHDHGDEHNHDHHQH